jgi:DNA-binding Lrp family transcriptional regulator
MLSRDKVDRTDARLLLALQHDPRATVMALATSLGLSRNTVQARLARLQALPGFGPLGQGVDTGLFGYPLTAFISVTVVQSKLTEVSESLAAIPEVIEVFGLTGEDDLLVRVAGADADDLYRIAGTVLATDGVERTRTSLVMRRLVDHRLEPLLDHRFGPESRPAAPARSARPDQLL